MQTTTEASREPRQADPEPQELQPPVSSVPGGEPGLSPALRAALPAIFALGRILIAIVGRTPRPIAHAIAAAVSIPLRRITWRTCRRNIDAFFTPLGWTEPQRDRLFRAHQRYMVRLRLDAARVLSGPEAELTRVTELHGEEHLIAARAAGRGVLLVGAHEGTWWHAPTLLARRGHDIRSVFNSFPLATIDEYLVDRARARGIRLSLVDQGAASAFKACSRENAAFYLTFDLAVRPRSAELFPFGRVRLPVERGPAILALRLGMPIIIIECEQLPDGRSLVRLRPPLDPRDAAGRDPDALCRLWVAHLEARVRARPEQWWPWGFAELSP